MSESRALPFLKSFTARELSEPLDDIESILLEVEQCNVANRVLVDQVEGGVLRLVTLQVVDELASDVSRIRSACNRLRSKHRSLKLASP